MSGSSTMQAVTCNDAAWTQVPCGLSSPVVLENRSGRDILVFIGPADSPPIFAKKADAKTLPSFPSQRFQMQIAFDSGDGVWVMGTSGVMPPATSSLPNAGNPTVSTINAWWG